MQTFNPAVERLGYAPDARLVIFHVDDVGMCHGANVAFAELAAVGPVTCGSIMMPCPWSHEALQMARADPTLDLGVHLTLNSEWTSGYRWGPMSTRDPASGLIDESGWFHHRPPQTLANLNQDAAVAEMRAQVSWAQRSALDFTHLDTHMGVAVAEPLLPAYVEMGFEFNVPVLLPRGEDDYTRSLSVVPLDEGDWRLFVSAVERRGMPLVDAFRITPADEGGGAAGRAALYIEILRGLPPGITYFSLHANAPGEIEAINPQRAHWRTFEYDWFRSAEVTRVLAEERIVPIGYRALRDLMRGR